MLEQNEVDIAFELLLEEIESVIDALNKEAEEAFKSGDYEKVKTLIEYATKITEFREKVKNIQKEWQTLFATKTIKIKRTKKEVFKKLRSGLKTPEDAFKLPILESLIELGGRAEAKAVLDKVRQKMKNVLSEYDKQPLKSGELRWKNTARWARNTMVNEGLLAADSPSGIWEITEKGRLYIELASKGENKLGIF